MSNEFAAWRDAPWTDEELAYLGIRSAHSGGLVFCGVTEEQFAINGHTYQWPRGSKLTWGIASSRFGRLSDMDLKDVVSHFLEEIVAACEIEFTYVPNAALANIYLISQRLDGPSGVLADMQIPTGNVTPATQLRGRFDDLENWVVSETPKSGEIDIYRVGLHEWLHALGLGHRPVSIPDPALIAPVYSRTIRNLQPADKGELVRRYGPARIAPPSMPPPPVSPTPGAKPVSVTVTQDGKEWSGSVPRTK